MSLSKSKCLYSNNCLCVLKRGVPLLLNIVHYHDISLSFMKFHEILYHFVITDQNFFAKFGLTDLKILLDIHLILLTFVNAVQNGQIFWQLLL